MEGVERARRIYREQYLPRWVRVSRGEVHAPCIDWHPPRNTTLCLELTDSEGEEGDGGAGEALAQARAEHVRTFGDIGGLEARGAMGVHGYRAANAAAGEAWGEEDEEDEEG
jgi:hypothetical protein